MRRDAIPGAPRSDCAPRWGGCGSRPARSGWRSAGIRLPSRRLTALIVLGILGPIGLSREEPGWVPPRMRLVTGEPGRISVRQAFSPGGEALATARGDGRLLIRDIRDGRESVRMPEHLGMALAPAFSPDGRTLALG